MSTREMPRRFRNILYRNGVNPNNYTFISANHEDFTIKSKKTGKVLLLIRF